jgi:hypothetical protein
MDELEKEIAQMGVTFAKDLAEQLITLSTGILALTITFTKDVVKDTSNSPMRLLKLAWVSYLLSICFGVWAMSALTGTLVPLDPSTTNASLSINFNARLPAGLQVISFLIGVLLITLFGAMSLRKESQTAAASDMGKD